MDITRVAAAGRLLVQSYGAGAFKVAGARHQGSILLFPDKILPWSVAAMADVTADSLRPVADADPPVDVLIIGCGARHGRLAPSLSEALGGVAVDVMATGPACRTYNVLAGEDRRVAAALIAID